MIWALGRLSQNLTVSGDLEKALTYAKRRLDLDRLDETAHRAVMNLLAKSGRRPDALAQYTVCQKILNDELGVKPDAETTALYQQILSQKYPESSSPSFIKHNLPSALTPLVGRQQELDKLCMSLANRTNRLVTVIGSGGSGKTRLALQAGWELLPVFPNGVFRIELDAQQPQETLAPLIARCVGPVQATEGNPFGYSDRYNLEERLFRFLQDKKLLLILDGFEGMLNETGFLNNLLRRTTELKILVTSRIRLNLSVEQIFMLEGLSYPQQAVEPGELTTYGAAQLFVEATRRSHPDFATNETNCASIVTICQLLHGMPLGILLAAAWIEVLEPEQIIEQIQNSLDFLAADWIDLPARQRSLRATFDYSLQRLDHATRFAFLRLSIFHSAFSAQRAWQVTGVSLQTLKFLVDQSLLQPTGQGQFRIHELLRQYAQHELASEPGEEQQAHEQHCQVFMAGLAAREPHLKSSRLFKTLAEMDQEYPDLLEAWDWAARHSYIALLEPAVWALGQYQLVRDHLREGEAWCEKTIQWLEQEGINPQNLRLWVRMGNLLANFFIRKYQFDHCQQVLDQVDNTLRAHPGLAADLRREQAFLLFTHGDYYRYRGDDNAQALEFFLRGMELVNGSEDQWDICFGLVHVAAGQEINGNHRAGQHYAELGLETQRLNGDPILIHELLEHLGYALMFTGRSEKAIQIVEEQVKYLQPFDDRIHKAYILAMRGLVRFHAGRYEQARPILEQCVALFSNQEEEKDILFFNLWLLDLIQLANGNYTSFHFNPPGSGENQPGLDLMRHKYFLNLSWGIMAMLRQDWSNAEENLQSYTNCLKDINRLEIMGLSLSFLGFIAYRHGDLSLARERLIAALKNCLEQGYYLAFCTGLGVLAVILAEAGEIEQAVELYTVATVHPGAGNAHFFVDILGKPIARLAENLPAETVQAARARGQSRELAATGQEYLAKLNASAALISGLRSEIAHPG